MKRFNIILSACFLMASCAVDTHKQDVIANNKPIENIDMEQLPSPFEVYDAMAVAAKYNIDFVMNENAQKLSDIKNGYYNAEEKIAKFIGKPLKNDVFSAYQKLNAAILIAEDKPDVYYQNALKNLFLLGANVYNKAGFAKNKSLDLSRIESYYTKELSNIDKKEKRIGKLSEADYKKKEALELFLLKADKLQKKYQINLDAFESVEKVMPKDVAFGSRRYFDVKSFKPEFVVENFENLALATNMLDNLEKNKATLLKQYPNAYRIAMDKQTYKNEALYKEILMQADDVCKKVVEKDVNVEVAEILRIKLAFYIAKISNLKYMDAVDNYKKASFEYAEAKKDRDQFVEALNKRMLMIEADFEKNNALGSYALAVQNLYFITDKYYIEESFLERPVGIIAKDLRKYISLNLSELMADKNFKEPEVLKTPALNQPKQWATEGENWIENVVGNASEKKYIKTEKGKQIGAFYQYDNAKKLMEENTGAKIEKSVVGQKVIYRVIVE